MSALLHSQILQGVGRGPTPGSAASKSLSPKPTNSEKTCAGHGVSPSALWGLPMLWADATHGSHWLFLVSLQSQGGLWGAQSPSPEGVSRTGREKGSPWDAHNHLHLQSWLSLKEMSETHCPAQESAFVWERIQTSMMIFSSSPHEWSWLIYPGLGIFIWIILTHFLL